MRYRAPAADPRSTRRLRLAVGSLPLLASLGSLITIRGGFFGFRVVAVVLVTTAVLRLLRREDWGRRDLSLLAATAVTISTGTVQLVVSGAAQEGALTEFLPLALALALTLAARPLHRRDPALGSVVCRGWVLAGVVATTIAIWEITTGQHLANHASAVGAQPTAGLGNPNSLAIFLVLSGIFGSAVRIESRGAWRFVAWLQLLVTPLVLWQCGARAAILVFGVTCAWMAWRRTRRVRDDLTIALVCAFPLLVALAALVTLPTLVTLVSEVGDPTLSGSVRLNLTLNGVRLLWESGGLGTGPGTFETAMAQLSAPLPTGMQVNAHNAWIELAVQYGLLSALLLASWLVLTAAAARRLDDPTRMATVALVLLAVLDSSLLPSAQFAMALFTIGLTSRHYGPGPTAAPRTDVRPGHAVAV